MINNDCLRYCDCLQYEDDEEEHQHRDMYQYSQRIHFLSSFSPVLLFPSFLFHSVLFNIKIIINDIEKGVINRERSLIVAEALEVNEAPGKRGSIPNVI